ncbi:MAG: hypothetical protein ABIH24_02915 [Verrucomicrobiota bacterium]
MVKTLNFTIPLMAACCLAVLMTIGCEDNSSSLNPPSVDVTGTWSMQDDLTDVHTMVLGQSGNTITGSVATFAGQTTAIVGFISDANITMLMSLGTSNTVDYVGLASRNSMSGIWRNSASSTEGTWTATRK